MSHNSSRPLNPTLTLEPPQRSNLGHITPDQGSPRGSSHSLASDTPVSLSVNYLPSKFSRPGSPALHKRRVAKDGADVPKRGGGLAAFKSGEARMPGAADEDYDGVDFNGKEGGGTKPKLRWNKFKWMLFTMNIFLTLYSIIALIFCLMTWFNFWTHADVVRVGNRPELIISTLAASLGIVTSLIGWSGILLNNRSFLAIYCAFLWVCFGLMVAPGYITYKRKTFNLEGKVNAQWSRYLGTEGRLRIQNQLKCCGYFSPYIEATVSQTCYARSIMPGCKNDYLKFERHLLTNWYAAAFSLVPLHIAVIVTSLLCSNHITYRFGKGMMPKAYRLSMNSMAVIMDQYASQLAEQYGTDVASEIMTRSNLQLDAMPSMPYASNSPTAFGHGATYGSVGEDKKL